MCTSHFQDVSRLYVILFVVQDSSSWGENCVYEGWTQDSVPASILLSALTNALSTVTIGLHERLIQCQIDRVVFGGACGGIVSCSLGGMCTLIPPEFKQ
jgi:hypothetical protein